MAVPMLRNTSAAGSSAGTLVCKLQFVCRLSPVWQPRESRGHELPTLFIANGTSGTSQVDGHEETQQEQRTREERDLCMLGL